MSTEDPKPFSFEEIMLKISKNQIEAFKAQARARFEDEIASRLEKNLPDSIPSHDKDVIKNLIRLRVSKASTYGFRSKKEVEQYISLLFMLPIDFGADPNLSWVSEILTENHSTPKTKLKRLEEEMKIYAMRQHPG